jgi:hypothetical protein
MKTVHFFGVLIALVLVGMMAGSAQAADRWYVVQHSSGQTTVTNDKPGPDWVVTFGPFDTEDAAIRASGIGAGVGLSIMRMTPSKSYDQKPEGYEFGDMYFFREAG